MKSLLLLTCLVASAAVLSAQALATWDFESAGFSGVTPVPASVLPASAQVTVALNAGIQPPPAPNAADNSLAAYFFPAAGTGYYQVELLCPTGTCDFNGIDALVYKSSGAPASLRVEYSVLSGFASPTVVGTYALNASGGTTLSIPVNALQVSRVTVRLYGLGATNNFGTLYLGSISLNGTVSTAPLPATLTSFRAKPADGKVYVQWSTASEINVDAFVVEVAQGTGEEFAAVAKVQPEGGERTGASYELPIAARTALLYIRLRTLDRDGSSALSEVISVRPPFGKTSWRAALAETQLQLSSDQDGTYILLGTQGEIHARGQVRGGATEVFDLGYLPAGLYYLNLNGRSQRLLLSR